MTTPQPCSFSHHSFCLRASFILTFPSQISKKYKDFPIMKLNDSLAHRDAGYIKVAPVFMARAENGELFGWQLKTEKSPIFQRRQGVRIWQKSSSPAAKLNWPCRYCESATRVQFFILPRLVAHQRQDNFGIKTNLQSPYARTYFL